MLTELPANSDLHDELRRRIAELESELGVTVSQLHQVTAERDKLRHAYEQLKTHLDLLRRRIFMAKAERIDTHQLELEFAQTHAQLVKLSTELTESPADHAEIECSGADEPPPSPGRSPRSKPTGRRNLAELDLPEERIEILDPTLEGVAERIGFEDSYQIGYRRGGPIRIVKARAVYKMPATDESSVTIVTAPNPKEIYDRAMLAPSAIAHILTRKFCWGMPFHRLSKELASYGFELEDSTMGRYAEHVGATLGAIIAASAAEAKATAFCLSTDATGVAIQPARIADGRRQACTKGHFFVVLADKDHVFFEYQPKHTSAAVCSMFQGFSGYIQADAHCVYDALFRGQDCCEPTGPPKEVACRVGGGVAAPAPH